MSFIVNCDGSKLSFRNNIPRPTCFSVPGNIHSVPINFLYINFQTETMSRRESERASMERETEVVKQNQHLTDQVLSF